MVTSTPVDLDDFKSLIVFDDRNYIATANGSENFTLDRIKELDYFDQILPKLFFLTIIIGGVYKKPSCPTEEEFEKVI